MFETTNIFWAALTFLCQIAKLSNRWYPCFHCVIVPFRTMKSSFVKSHRVYCIYIDVVSSLNYLIEFLLFGVRHLWHSPFFFIKRLSICAEQHLSNKRCWQHYTLSDLLNFDSNSFWIGVAWNMGGLDSTAIKRRQQQLGRMANFPPSVTFSVFDL